MRFYYNNVECREISSLPNSKCCKHTLNDLAKYLQDRNISISFCNFEGTRLRCWRQSHSFCHYRLLILLPDDDVLTTVCVFCLMLTSIQEFCDLSRFLAVKSQRSIQVCCIEEKRLSNSIDSIKLEPHVATIASIVFHVKLHHFRVS